MRYAIVDNTGRPLYTCWTADFNDAVIFPTDNFLIELSKEHTDTEVLNSYWNGTEWIKRPDNLPTHFKYDRNSATWVDGRDLEEEKSKKNYEINNQHFAADVFTFNDKEFQMSGLSRINIQDINAYVISTQNLPPGFNGTWKAKDNTYIQIDNLETWNSFYAAMVNQIFVNFQKMQDLKALVDSATSLSEVDAISW